MEYYSTVLWHLKREVDLSHLAQEAIALDRLDPRTWCIMGNCFSLQKVYLHPPAHHTTLKRPAASSLSGSHFQQCSAMDHLFLWELFPSEAVASKSSFWIRYQLDGGRSVGCRTTTQRSNSSRGRCSWTQPSPMPTPLLGTRIWPWSSSTRAWPATVMPYV